MSEACTTCGLQVLTASVFPAQVAALEAAQQVDPVAKRIGAANTLVRQQDGSLKAYNTDWSAAIQAVEQGFGGGCRLTITCCQFHAQPTEPHILCNTHSKNSPQTEVVHCAPLSQHC